MKSNILFVDDDQEFVLTLCRGLQTDLKESEWQFAGTEESAIAKLPHFIPDVAIIDLSIDSRGVESGYSTLRSILAQSPTTRCIVLTGHGAAEYGIRAIAEGAAHFMQKPPDIKHLAVLIKDGISQSLLRKELRAAKKDSADDLNALLVCESSVMQEVAKIINQAAVTNQSVLLTGETGTGKSLCANLIHRLGARHSKSFVAYSPGLGTGDLIQSELFGHTKGAFTGALNARKGLVAEANGGTLFLDEIDEFPIPFQVTLLAVLQDKKYRAVGANVEETSDFRLITASNRDIQQSIDSGKLRHDLFHRIAHINITIPPLRERSADIPRLGYKFLEKLQTEELLRVRGFEDDAIDAILKYPWPGNIRELAGVIESGAYRAQFEERTTIAKKDLHFFAKVTEGSSRTAINFHDKVECYKRELVEAALKEHGGNQVKAAQALGLDRSSLRRVLGRTQ